MKKIICFGTLLLWIGFQGSGAIAQDWKKIVPLVSTCEDVKRVFGIEKCEYPLTTYENSEYKIEIKFFEKSYFSECDLNSEYKNIAKGTVVSVYVRGGKWLKEFEPDLSGYEMEQVYDLPDNFIYKNKTKGIEFETTGGDKETEKVVVNVTYHPSAENAAKFGCSLQWKEVKPLVSKCEDIKRIFKIDKCTYPTTEIKTDRFSLTVDFPKIVCGKKCHPKTDCWKISRDTVLSMAVEPTHLSETMTVKDFGSEWSFFKDQHPDFLDSLKFTDADTGIALDAKLNGHIITKIYFFPSRSDEKKYRCQKTRK